MANHDVIDLSGKKVGSIELNDQVFAAPIKKYLLTEVVEWQRAKARRGTQSVKTRTEVNGTTKKPYGQKHTGNARQGDLKAPHMRGGGVAFAPKPRDYEFAMPKAKRRAALATALTLKVKEGNLRVVKSFELKETKTKTVKSAIDALKTGATLIVDGDNEKLAKSARNLADSRYLNVSGLNVVDLLRYPSLVMTEAAVATITQRLLGEGGEKP
ncbi:MAG: 50S ribosomal protein L4 [Deltaproteobacteria bacterium]|nr:50S ribosomal protein L4 [Deltaproteobacteria bacterium]